MGVCIAIAGQKGGVGKSTIARNIASYFCNELNAKTMLVDADSQKTCKKWFETRLETLENNKLNCMSLRGDLYEPLKNLRNDYDVVVVDNAGYLNESLETSLLASDLCIMPYNASDDDLHTAPTMNKTIKNAKRFNKNLDSYVVIARATAHSAKSIKDDIEETKGIFDDNNIKRFNTIIHNRTPYQRANNTGLGAIELKQGYGDKAKDEITELMGEVTTWLKGRAR